MRSFISFFSIAAVALSLYAGDAPRGIFCILVGDYEAPDADAILARPEIDGITFYNSWRTVEPSEGNVRWQAYDTVLAAAEKHGKRAVFSLNTGNWISNWVYDKGVKKISFTSADDYMTGKVTTRAHASPVPWDPVFLDLFSVTVKKFGARYNSRQGLAAVNITGPAPENGIEPCMPLGGRDELLEVNGYTAEKFTGAWKRMIDTFAASFPSHRLVMATHDMFGSKRFAEPSMLIHRYGFSAYPERYGISALFLTHDAWFGPENSTVKIVTSFAGKGHTGMQLIRKYKMKELPASDVAAAMEKGITLCKADWIEVFKDDVNYAPYRDVLTKFHTRLTGGK